MSILCANGTQLSPAFSAFFGSKEDEGEEQARRIIKRRWRRRRMR